MRPLVEPKFDKLQFVKVPPSTIETELQPVTLWSEPKGLNTYHPLNKLGIAFASDMTNFMFKNGQFASRLGTRILGNEAPSIALQTTDMIRPNGKKVTVRFCTRHIEVMNYATEVWRTFVLPFHGGVTDLFTWTSWGDKLIFSNFVDGMWELDFATYSVTQVPGAPGCKHLTTFGNRVVATAVNFYSKFLPYRIQWSVKNNYLDWTGIGSGYEDMFGAPGGLVDEAMKTIPMTDEMAYVVRSQTIWQMSLSGVAIAPFRFSRVMALGCPYRHTIAETPRGMIFVGRKSVFGVNVNGVDDLGLTIINYMKQKFSDLRIAYGIYEPTRDEYRVACDETVFRYRWEEQGWTIDEYPVTIRSLGVQISGRTGYPIDSLVGIVDNLVGTVDELSVDRPGDDKIYITPTNGQVSIYEMESDDPVKDVLEDGTLVDTTIEIQSGILSLDILEAAQALEIHFEYECDEIQSVDFLLSTDGGFTWLPLSSRSLKITHLNSPEMTWVKTEHVGRKLMFRLLSNRLGRMLIRGVTPKLVKVNRAR